MRTARLGIAMAALAALWLAMLLLGAGAADRAVLDSLYAADRPWLATAARWVTELGGSPLLLPLTAAVALLGWRLGGDWRRPAWFAAMVLAGRLLVELQKVWTMRLRPDAHPQLAPITSYAFPSGHGANATMVWLGAALLLTTGRWRRPALAAAAVIAVAVGFSRPVLGVHWPSDVVAGWSLGLFWTLLWVRLSTAGGTAAPAAHSPPKGE